MALEEDNSNQEKITFRCPKCGKRLSALKSKLEADFSCPYCGFVIPPGKQENNIPIRNEQNVQAQPPSSSPESNTKKSASPVPAPSVQPDQIPFRKKESAFINYSLIGLSLFFCGISILLFSKTLAIKISPANSNNIENLLIDREAEQAIYTPADISDETIELASKEDEEEAKRLSHATRFTSGKPDESDIQSINDAFASFIKAKNITEKIPFIFEADKMKPLIEKWDASNPSSNNVTHTIILEAAHNEPFMIIRSSLSDGTVKDAIFIREKKSSKWKIDWPSFVGYSEYKGKELKAARPEKPVIVRALISISNLYESPFLDRPDAGNYKGKSYLNVNIVLPDGQEFCGYVDRHSDVALSILEKLSAGTAQAMITISFPTDPVIRENVVIIDSFIRDNWLSDQANDILNEIKPNN